VGCEPLAPLPTEVADPVGSVGKYGERIAGTKRARSANVHAWTAERSRETAVRGGAVIRRLTEYARLARRLPRVLLGRDPVFRRDVRVRCETIGRGYGAWAVVPSLLQPGDVALCFGIGEDIGFENQMAARFGMEVHAFDPTPSSLEWLSRQPLHARVTVHPYGLSDSDGFLGFSPPEHPGRVSLSAVRRSVGGNMQSLPVRSLPSIASEIAGDRAVSLLKMDVEGSEYAVITHMELHSVRPVQLLVEFHHRFPEIGASRTLK
jgi:FkbM family methyltransferase